MVELRKVNASEMETSMDIINGAKEHLKQQGIDQWQNGYPECERIQKDISGEKGFFLVDEGTILGYLCIDYDGEPAYDNLNGEWQTSEAYVVVHRMAFTEQARGRGLSSIAFGLVEKMSKEKGIASFRIDTDAGNQKMQHVLKKNGFEYRGTIWFENSEKIAFDKKIK